jgi:hypothetical protein
MNLEGIISISGKGGLYKLISQSRGGFIVEALADGKRFPVQSTNNVSSLSDIAMYTYEEEIPLSEVFTNIAKKENEGPSLSHKESAKKLKEYFGTVLPDFDEDRVYSSDIKKVFQWYNILQSAGIISIADEKEDTIEDADVVSED